MENTTLNNSVGTTVNTAPPAAMLSFDNFLEITTKEFLETYPDVLSNPAGTNNALLATLNAGIVTENSARDNDSQWGKLNKLPSKCVADILNATGLFANITLPHSSEKKLYMYQSDGCDKGIYKYVDIRLKTGPFFTFLYKYIYTASTKFSSEILVQLANSAPDRELTLDDYLVPVGNGVFNVDTLDFIDYDDPNYRNNYVYIKKTRTNYNANAIINPVVIDPDTGESYNLDDVLDSYFGKDTDMTTLLWQFYYALVRYNKNYNTVHFFCNVDDEGNAGSNGKGLLLDLARNLLGFGNYGSVKLQDLSTTKFGLWNLHDCIAILVDEIATNIEVKQLDTLRSLATRDSSVTTERKYADPRTGRWDGTMGYACNGWPYFKDPSASTNRRMYLYNFTKRFVGDSDKSFLKETFIYNTDVLEYLLYKILHFGNIKKLIRPAEIDENMRQYLTDSSSDVSDFLDKFLLSDGSGSPTLQWDLLPFKFLFDFYRSWYMKERNRIFNMQKKDFRNAVITWAMKHPDDYNFTTGDINRHVKQMETLEPLIATYDVTDWKQTFTGIFYTNPSLVSTYTGALFR